MFRTWYFSFSISSFWDIFEGSFYVVFKRVFFVSFFNSFFFGGGGCNLLNYWMVYLFVRTKNHIVSAKGTKRILHVQSMKSIKKSLKIALISYSTQFIFNTWHTKTYQYKQYLIRIYGNLLQPSMIIAKIVRCTCGIWN